MRALSYSLLVIATFMAAFSAFAQKSSYGSVMDHSGEPGELIVSRDGIVYWLSTGDDLFENDVLRAQEADSATIRFKGCVFTLPEQEDVELDDEFCVVAAADEPSMAAIASEAATFSETSAIPTGVNAPLIVGGVVLSAGGIAAATNGGGGGTGSEASAAAGAPQGSTASGS